MKIRVHIADDHPMVITGIRNMLVEQDTIVVEEVYGDGRALLEGLEQLRPDIILLDIEMPFKRGDELTAFITKKYPEVKILALTNFDSTIHVQNMLRHGARGYLLKTTDQVTLVQAIETVYKGEIFLQEYMKERMAQLGERLKREITNKSSLTEREVEILQLLVDGYSSPEIAEKLFLSTKTIDNYRFNLLLKLDAKNTANLVKKALEMGLIQ